MTLFWLCQHGEAKAHGVQPKFPSPTLPFVACPGGHPVEGGEKVWWCDEHQNIGGETRCQHGLGDRFAAFVADQKPCRMVERFLIPLSNSETEK